MSLLTNFQFQLILPGVLCGDEPNQQSLRLLMVFNQVECVNDGFDRRHNERWMDAEFQEAMKKTATFNRWL